jgi:hypothetical protein
MNDILKKADSTDRDKIAVAKDFLDRAGFKPDEKIELYGEIRANPYVELTGEELKQLAAGDVIDGDINED